MNINDITITEKTITKKYITYENVEISLNNMISLLETVVGSSYAKPAQYSGCKLDIATKMAENNILTQTVTGSYYEKDKTAINKLLTVCYTKHFEKEISEHKIIENYR